MKGINFNTSLTNTAPTGPRQNNSVGETASQASTLSANNSDNASNVSIAHLWPICMSTHNPKAQI